MKRGNRSHEFLFGETLPPCSGTPDYDLFLLGATPFMEAPENLNRLHALGPVIVMGPSDTLPHAFSLGCDDYLRDPWTPEELFSRIKLPLKGLQIRIRGEELLLAGDGLVGPGGTISLGQADRMLLRALATRPGEAVDRALLSKILDGESTREQPSRALDMRISRLRREIEGALPPKRRGGNCIEGVYGAGYRLDCG